MFADGMTKSKQGMEFEEFKIAVGVHDQDTKERAEETEYLVVPDLSANSAVEADQE